MPRVLNKKDMSATEIRTLGNASCAIYIGRPSKWGNPFIIGNYHVAVGRKMDRTDVIALHKRWLRTSPRGQKCIKDIEELCGKDLVCWCAPKACHGDLLLELAND